ncbi:MAG: lamin tail domain-containing protein [Candidatus Cloacimonetes bacterium]|nr:lamin tail domain-containing protein [Candidatus Cloacimonadota bacterium]
MKRNMLLVLVIIFLSALNAQNIWFNEIHYDNFGTDQDEFLEIILENPGNYDLADFSIILYNGNGGIVYDTKSLDQFTAGQTIDNFSFYYFIYPVNGIQNGGDSGADGMCLVYQGTMVAGQFLSYEGTLVAADGPAAGVESIDIGVIEPGEVGHSLQLYGTGSQYADFVWEGPLTNTMGALNANQVIGGSPDPTIIVTSPNGGEIWEQGSTHNITWASLNFTDNVKIELETVDRSREILIASAPNTGSWPWNIPAGQPVSDWYVIIVSNAAGNEPWDDSDAPFSIVEPATVIDVATVAELRAGNQDGTLYRLTGEAVLTFQQDWRHQKIIQDETAGILIDDLAGVIQTTYELGDGIINLTGTLTEYGGLIQFNPSLDAGIINSTGNEIIPEIISLAQFNANFEEYESELITVLDVTFQSTGNFGNGIVYTITDPSRNEADFRTTFYDVDYIGTPIPTYPVNLTAIPNSRVDGDYLTSRFLSDFEPAAPDEIITVISPNGGESWHQGTQQQIQWTSVNFTGQIRIEILQAGENPAELVTETEDDGVWSWVIPEDFSLASDYSIRISDTADGEPFDVSDNYFSIVAGVQQPEVGDIIITEIMQNPQAVSDNEGEWFEIYNISSNTYNLIGWYIKDIDTDQHLIDNGGDLFIYPGSYLVLGINSNPTTNGGVAVDYEYSGITLANGVDEILICWIDGETVIDAVAYDDGATFPDPAGASMELIPAFFDHLANDDGMYWYTAYWPFGDGDLGSPGELNPGPLAPPGTPSSPQPEDQATGVDLNTDLQWSNGEGTSSIDLFFDTVNPPETLLLENAAAVEFYELNTLEENTQYFWQVVCRNVSDETPGPIWTFTTLSTGADPPVIPPGNLLLGNYPNPFNPATEIRFSLNQGCQQAELKIFNLKGELIRTYRLDTTSSNSLNSIFWNGRDENGQEVPSGLYFYRLNSGEFSDTRKMVLLK